MLKPKYKLSPLAEEDLLQINTTTIKLWGSGQARGYALKIESILLKLAQYPEIGFKREALFHGARSFPIENILFFSVLLEMELGFQEYFNSEWIQSRILKCLNNSGPERTGI